MLKTLFTLLSAKLAPPPRARIASQDDEAVIFENLAMTEELREALFPKTPQMVSAIFDRPEPLSRPPAPSSPPPAQSFPIIF